MLGTEQACGFPWDGAPQAAGEQLPNRAIAAQGSLAQTLPSHRRAGLLLPRTLKLNDL